MEDLFGPWQCLSYDAKYCDSTVGGAQVGKVLIGVSFLQWVLVMLNGKGFMLVNSIHICPTISMLNAYNFFLRYVGGGVILGRV